MRTLRAAADRAGVRLVGFGVDPCREPGRILDLPRYAAMERFFDRSGRAGRWMMANTASVQVCLDAGEGGGGPEGFRARWRLAHAIGPVLVAAFANSAIARDRPTGWASTRQAIWARMDSTRTDPVGSGEPALAEVDPVEAWIRYALDARIMLVRRDERAWTAPADLTFRNWIRLGGSRPTRDDLDYHLSTLFPPVRPRGYLELRMIDAQQRDGWIVPLAVCAAILGDPAAGAAALGAVGPLWRHRGAGGAGDSRPWLRAARFGLTDPTMAAVAATCFREAIHALPAGAARSAVESFADRYVERGRSPADDALDDYYAAATGPTPR